MVQHTNSSISVFEELFASIDKTPIFAGIFDPWLSFYEVYNFSDFFFFVRSEALNRSPTPEATPIYHVYK